MTQPDRPDRAASERAGEERVAAQLRQAAHSYEPDGEKIRRLIDARSAAVGGTPVSTRRPRGLGGRTVLWPVLGSAAAAAVIMAVAASGATGPTPAPATNDPAGTVTLASEPTAPSASASGATAIDSPVSTSVSPTATGTPVGSATPGATTIVTTSPKRPDSSGRPGPKATPPAPGAGKVPAVRRTIGGRDITVTVASAPPEVTVGGGGEEFRVVNGTGPQPQAQDGKDVLGPGQPMVASSAVRSEPSPIRVHWQNGERSAPSGTAGTWLTAEAVSTDLPLLRLPIRYKHNSSVATLYLGTVGGAGRLELTSGAEKFSVNLPGCASATCVSTVTVTIRWTDGNLPSAGDLGADLYAVSATKVGLAAASMR